jgi:hypothetical protein
LPIPLEEYRSRLVVRTAALARWSRRDLLLSRARLGLLAIGLLLAWLAFRLSAVSPFWLLAPVGLFLAVMVFHDRAIRARDAAARAVAFYTRGIARLEDRWAGGGEQGLRFADEEHLYAADLDLFGRGSLFELLSTARTHAGEEALAAWLKEPAPVDAIRRRQEAVRELQERLDFREALALAGSPVGLLDTTSLSAWATRPPLLKPTWPRVVAPLLVAAVFGGVAWIAAGGTAAPLVVALIAEFLFTLIMWSMGVLRVVHGVDRPSADLDVLAQALTVIERGPAASPRLRTLQQALVDRGVPASEAIRRLHRLSELHDWEHNLIFAVIGAVLLWSTQLAFAVEAWRRRFGPHVPDWVRTLGEFEALSSLATYAYEHPADPFPTFVDEGSHQEAGLDGSGPSSQTDETAQGSWTRGSRTVCDGQTRPAESDRAGARTIFDGTALGHPMVPAAQMVTNDVRLTEGLQLLLISGSNMSGKSTLLRTVGINAVLAMAGAPVRAARVDLTPLSVGATLRIQDSLQQGKSRFLAEISRIRRIAELATGPLPLLFLFDELLQGTNSHDRVVGAAAVLRHLVDRGAAGLITTHDLAMTALVDELGHRAINVHFEDRLEGDELAFDYVLKPGPVTRSNALALMRAVGLTD